MEDSTKPLIGSTQKWGQFNSEIGIDYLKNWISIEKFGIGIEKFGIGIEVSNKQKFNPEINLLFFLR